MDALIYFANTLYLLSYFTRNILYLRIFTIIAACCLTTYFYNQPEPLMTVVGWNMVFIALNVYQLTRILLERSQGRTPAPVAATVEMVQAGWSI